jgi:hypothetical protein
MIINNHFCMNIVDELNNEFSKQKSLYKVGQQPVAELEKYKQIAMGYAEMENAVSVLSDMHTNVSYVYYGRFSQVFGWNRENGTEEKNRFYLGGKDFEADSSR